MNDLQALRAAVLSISSASDFDSFVESTDAYLKLFEKKIHPVRNNSKKSTRLYGHLAVSVWAIMSQFEYFKKKMRILPEFLLIKMADFMSLHLNLMVQSRVTDDGYVNRFKHFLLCVLKSNYEYVMIAFMKSSKTIAFCNSPVIPPLLKKINSHIINYDRDLSCKHPLEVAWRYMFLKICQYKFAFKSKGTLALYEDINKYMEEKQWSKPMFEAIDLKWNELLDVFLILSDRAALWIESRRLPNVMPYEKMLKQHSERKCTLVDIEVDVFFSLKSICQNGDTLKYRDIDIEFNEEETSIQKCWNTQREAFGGTDDHLLQNEDDNWNIDTITNPFPPCVISHIDSVLDYTIDNIHQFSGLVIDDNNQEQQQQQQQHFNVNCDILDKVLCQIAENFLSGDSRKSSTQFVPNSVDSIDSEPLYPNCCQEFTIGSNQFQKWNSNLKTFQFMSELTGSERILHNDRIVTINRMIEIADLDFCRTEDVPKASIAMDYANRAAERHHQDFNKTYNMFVLNEKDKCTSALDNVPEPFYRDINEPMNDTYFGANMFNKQMEPDHVLSVVNHNREPIVEHVQEQQNQEPNELQYTHKKLGKRHRKNTPKSICSWVASNHSSGTLSLVLDVEIVTSNELIQSQHNKRKGRTRKRHKKIFRNIDGFWVNNENNGDFSELLPIDSEKYQKRLKEYPKPGPLSTKLYKNETCNKKLRSSSAKSTKKTKPIEINVQEDSDDTIILNGNVYSEEENNYSSSQENNKRNIIEELNQVRSQLNFVSATIESEVSKNETLKNLPKIVKRKKRRRRNRGWNVIRRKPKVPNEPESPPKLLEENDVQEEEELLPEPEQEEEQQQQQHPMVTRNKHKDVNGINNKLIIDEKDLSPTMNGDHIISSTLSDDCEYDHVLDSKTLRFRLKSTSSDEEQTLSQVKLIQKRKKVRKKRKDTEDLDLYISDVNNIKLACGKKHIVTPKMQLTPQSKLVSVNGFGRTGMRTRSLDKHFETVIISEHFCDDDDP